MSDAIDLSVDFAGLRLANPVCTASGTCGYADELADYLDLNRLGAFVTKSITVEPRAGNATPRIVETDAGMLNAIGLANIGLERFIREKVPLLEGMAPAVFVNVAGRRIEEYVGVAERLAECGAIAGLELNVSCPNVKQGGITFGTDPDQIAKVTAAVKAVAGGKCLMVKLTPSVTDITACARAAVDAGADALSLVNTFPAMVIDVASRRPVLANVTGGLSGPAIRPIAVHLVHRVWREVAGPRGIPLMGMGGIRTASDALEFILAGATAVAVGTATLIDPDTAERIINGLAAYCRRTGTTRLADLIGAVQ